MKELLFGGIASFQIDGKPFTGKIILTVNQGGLRNFNLPKKVKNLFKNIVRPVLVRESQGINQQFSGIIELNYGEGKLQRFDLITS